MAGTVLSAVYLSVMQGLQVFAAEVLPLALASFVKQAQGAIYDAGELVATADGEIAVYAALVRQLLPLAQADPGRQSVSQNGEQPTPVGAGNCDNSLLTPADYLGDREVKTVPDPLHPGQFTLVPIAPCLNPSPIPAATSTDPLFQLRPREWQCCEPRITQSPTLTLQSASDGGTSTTRVSGHWFVTRVGSDDFDVQTLRLAYVDWAGDAQIAYLLTHDDNTYSFVGSRFEGPVDPDTCVADGSCWSSDHIEYKTADGRDFTAGLELPKPPVGYPQVLTATPLSGAPVKFGPGLFQPADSEGMVTWDWRFQKAGCGFPCTTASGPDYTEPVPSQDHPSYTWETAGTYAVELTAHDGLGRHAVTTFNVTVGETPPQLSLRPACTPLDLTECNDLDAAVDQVVGISGAVDHPGALDNETATIDWGDGSSVVVANGPNTPEEQIPGVSFFDATPRRMLLNAIHRYSQPGVYYGTVHVRDVAGNTDDETFVVTITGTQTIAFATLDDRKYGDVVVMHATGGDSRQPVTFTASPAGVCTSSGNNGELITMVGLGACSVTARQAGSAPVYLPANPVTRTFQVTPAPVGIKVLDKTKTYGSPNPEFTARFDLLRNGDTAEDFTGLVLTGPPAIFQSAPTTSSAPARRTRTTRSSTPRVTSRSRRPR